MTNTAEETKNARIYEVSFLITPSLPEEKLSETVAQIKAIIQDHAGAVISEEFPKMRPLSYTVEKSSQGRIFKYDTAHFGWVKFECEPGILSVLNEFLEKSETIVRYLVIKTIRENTMTTGKFMHVAREEGKELRHDAKLDPAVATEPAAPKMTTEELDKTIEELVVE